MRTSVLSFLALLRDAFVEWIQQNATLQAAGIAYYTIFSLAPLLIFTVSFVHEVYPQANVEWRISAGIEKRGDMPAATYISDVLVQSKAMANSKLANGIGLLFLIWGASSMFLQLQSSINEMWGLAPKDGKIKHNLIAIGASRLLSAVIVLGAGLLVLGFLAASALATVLPAQELGARFEQMDRQTPFLRLSIVLLLSTILFAAMFKALPQAKIRWRDLWPGALLTALLVLAGNWLVGYYLANSMVKSLYGAAGSLMAFLLWVYYTAWVLLYGAKFTCLFAARYGVPIIPYDYMMVKASL